MKKLLFLVFLILAIVNYRYLNLGFLSLYSIDEYTYHGSLLNIQKGMLSFNLKQAFSFGFYSYGFVFFLINALASLPFYLADNIPLTIYIPRLLSSFFAVGSVWVVYKTLLLRTDKKRAFLLACLLLTMPAFWRNSLWFHPDWMMVFFMLCSIYFFTLDDWRFKRNFWLAIIMFGISVAVKIQAITFLPFIGAYIFYSSIQSKKIENMGIGIKYLGLSLLLVFGVFLLLNPYLLHPLGIKVFLRSFNENMESNATNHGVLTNVAIYDKITDSIAFYYLNIVVLGGVVAIALYSIVYGFFFSTKKSIVVVVSIVFLVNLGYLLFMVNKNWQHYYLSVFVIVPFIFLAIKDKFKHFNKMLIIVLLLQIATHFSAYYSVFTTNMDIDKGMEESKMQEISDGLIADLQGFVNPKMGILMSPYTPFEYEKINLQYENVKSIYGSLSKKMFILQDFLEVTASKDTSQFVPIDFIILSKKDVYFDSIKLSQRVDKKAYQGSLQIIQQLNDGTLGYQKFKETPYFYIWKKE